MESTYVFTKHKIVLIPWVLCCVACYGCDSNKSKKPEIRANPAVNEDSDDITKEVIENESETKDPYASLTCKLNSGLSLVGGIVARDGEMPGVIYLKPGCTAAKYGKYSFITAAHCLFDLARNVIKSEYAPGETIEITQSSQIDSETVWQELKIKEIYIHSSWKAVGNSCYDEYSCYSMSTNGSVSDVGIIVASNETPQIPTIEIDKTPVKEGEIVFVMGYGCENGYYGPQNYFPEARLKYKCVEVPSKNMISTYNSRIDPVITETVLTYNFLTTGFTWSNAAASLCPGDSGGPVLRNGKIIGVNAYYSFLSATEDPEGVAFINWHTRLSEPSVANWIP